MVRQAGKEGKAEIAQIEGAGSTRLGVCVGEGLAIGKQLARPGVAGAVAGGQTTYIYIHTHTHTYIHTYIHI